MTALLAAEDLSLEIGGRLLCHRLRYELRAHETWAILGMNGAGKTTFLHTLAGLRRASAGRVLLEGRPMAELPRRSVARVLGLLPQDQRDDFPAPVLETALLGRAPFLASWARESGEDRSRAQAALAAVGLETLATRSVTTLSGGERRRLGLAILLTQAPQIYLLDEPTNHLDLRHQGLVLDRMRKLAREGAAVAMTMHDPNLAARYADRILLLYGDGRWETGGAKELLTAERLTALYEHPITVAETPLGRIFLPG